MPSGTSASLARSITRSGSRQTYGIIRWLADADLAEDAFRAYAYYRWVDDRLDGDTLTGSDRLDFLERQQHILACATCGSPSPALAPEEEFLVELVRADRKGHPGLHSYVHHMMAVMSFDVRRRGRPVTSGELAGYTHALSHAVMDGLSYFVGHRVAYPATPDRWMAATGAHIVHMLRDASSDVLVGYYNVPVEFLGRYHLAPDDLGAPAYRLWVRQRSQLARRCFRRGRAYIGSLRNLRVRLAGYAYYLRFESALRSLEADGSPPSSALAWPDSMPGKAHAFPMTRTEPYPVPSSLLQRSRHELDRMA